MADVEPRGSEEIEAVLKAGGGVSISARWQGISVLVNFARLANSSGALLVLHDTDTLDVEALVQIAQAGKKNVIMDIKVSPQEKPRG